jgi:WXG100 family type VII secretion target
MANFTFSPEQARSVAGSIKSKGDNARDLVEQLSRQIKSVEEWWQGDSARAFVDEFDRLKPNFDKMVQCVNKISTQLNKIAEIKETNEREMAAQLKG